MNYDFLRAAFAAFFYFITKIIIKIKFLTTSLQLELYLCKPDKI